MVVPTREKHEQQGFILAECGAMGGNRNLFLENNMSPNIFAIYLTEEPDGTVIAKAEIVGKPVRAMDVGIEVMDGLKRLERDAAGLFKVQRFLTSSESAH